MTKTQKEKDAIKRMKDSIDMSQFPQEVQRVTFEKNYYRIADIKSCGTECFDTDLSQTYDPVNTRTRQQAKELYTYQWAQENSEKNRYADIVPCTFK